MVMGGLDGLSHRWTYAYCCYGLDLQASPGTEAKELRKKIVAKFRSDLHKLFELDPAQVAPVHKENNGLASVLRAGIKLKIIRLLCNYYRDKELLGDLIDVFRTRFAASSRRFVADDCSMTLWGPNEIVDMLTIDGEALFRIENPGLATILSEVDNTQPNLLPAPTGTDKLDEKINKVSNLTDEIRTKWKDEFLTSWRRNILLMQRLNNNFPQLHQRLERLRIDATVNAARESERDGHLVDTISTVQTYIQNKTESILERLPKNQTERYAETEVARLLGECSINWKTR
jgi:hypothetical protein